MKDTLKLAHPILLDGKTCTEFTFDTEEITSELFLFACAKSSISGTTMNAAGTMEINTALHLQLGKAAIIATNPHVDWGDLDRVKGADLVMLAGIGRVFTSGRSAELSEENNSAEHSENTQNSSTKASQSSAESV